jgi:cell fate (sporulation/competence/biofilm development) regulator YlbF (YheA/YmcA/DUF963 family)
MSDTTTETQTATQEQVPAIRSDSVVAYLSGMASALSAIVNDLNTQVAQITESMNKEPKNG